MTFSLNVILFLALHLLLGVKSSMVSLNNYGYDGIVIAINPSVPEDEKLIQNIKEMVTEASSYLFHATKRRAYFRNVSILIPMTWKSKSEYLMPKQESYDQAEVIVANPYPKYGDDPYTLQYGQCGEKGQYIHFTPNFLLTNNLPIYGPRGRVFVHEWAHLRWGIFDEYNVDRPFYISRKNTIEATRCSTSITGINVVFKECNGGSCITRPCRRDAQTGLYEAKCTFIPNKSQTARESIMFMQNLNSVIEFCTANTHNTEAPNLQNKMCNHRSTWDVIMSSDDFKNVSPMTGTNPPPHPTFSLLKAKQRVVCLVLDKSGSMNSDDRLIRMNQAAELYLIQIIEKRSLVGMVTFESIAKIQNNLTEITDDNAYQKITANLPKEAGGGTSICSGLKAGFQVITHNDQSTSGSEVILLTDGEDDKISSCFEEVKQSGATIHTIALGPSAAKELETLSNMTGGHRFYANKDINGLTDAFSRISSRSGSISQQALQLESKALNIPGRKWINDTVPVDSTIGNDTFFVVTWTIQKPDILLQDPKGKKYSTSDFKEDKLNIRSARLQIPGIAETGTWTYSLLNKHANFQLLTVTMTTRARSPTTLPVIATAHMSQNTAHYPSPMIVYARVSQGFLPVLGINVTAIIETEEGHQVTLELWDNGAGADTVKNDGIYSRYFTDYHGNGRYSLKVHARARKNTTRLSIRQQQNKALYIPGYIENGKITLNPPRPEVKDDVAEAEVEDFSRLTSGGSFTVSGAPPDGDHSHLFPPGKIADLEAKFRGDYIQLSWTAPGNVLDKGKADRYIVRISKHFLDLEENFDNAALINTCVLIPKDAGTIENFEFKPEPFKIENGTKFYIAIKAISEANLTSEISNIAQTIKFIPPQEPCVTALGTNIPPISLAMLILSVILSIF
ncbi:PREDICTED: LOW QUALITY PROTEIN: epithelial chloride channel protein-like [Galeopterus variegatus]|uniref:LOW QUALITY PROTEIN: epithelial chloride channel protein-like n=1 Tax=Galeopterus variegatus TaxID=482537 RepID=A0ABM0RIX5_GALVR|nr:PREDICTED: LOW QUALITY PROTEIN: epithelial chloride channel protein-like [Galeopterus variegatus]